MQNHDATRASRRHFLRVGASAVAGIVLGMLPFGAQMALAADAPLKIGVIGSGRIGGTLGPIWLKAGHEVMFSSLDLEHDKALAAKLGGKARAGTTKEAAAFGEVLLLAVPYSAVPQIGRDLGGAVQGKIVLDASNPIPSRDGEAAKKALEKGAGFSTAELLPGSRVVRAFNAIGYASQGRAAQRQGERIGMPMAGDDAAAIAVASRLIREIGFEPVLVGPLAMGKYLMPGTPLAGEHSPESIRKIAAGLK